MFCRRDQNLWRQVAAVTGGEFIKGLSTHITAPEWLGGNNVVQRREGLFHWGTNRGRLVTHL